MRKYEIRVAVEILPASRYIKTSLGKLPLDKDFEGSARSPLLRLNNTNVKIIRCGIEKYSIWIEGILLNPKAIVSVDYMAGDFQEATFKSIDFNEKLSLHDTSIMYIEVTPEINSEDFPIMEFLANI